jgi:3-oxoacyl-[acyl-carrier protein] reductase
LAEDSAYVFVNYVSNKSAAEETIGEIRKLNGQSEAIQTDVGNSDQVRSMFEQITTKFNGIDIVVNNAGIVNFKPPPIVDATDEYVAGIFNINTNGTLRCLREAAKCIRHGGRIINISSYATKSLYSNYSIYAASKAAVEALTIVLSKELKGRGVTVNCIAPGAIATDDWLNGKSQEIISTVSKLSPMERLGVPIDVASVVRFLATSQAEWINGQVLYLNGGSIL